jgi:hypothetical protein
VTTRECFYNCTILLCSALCRADMLIPALVGILAGGQTVVLPPSRCWPPLHSSITLPCKIVVFRPRPAVAAVSCVCQEHSLLTILADDSACSMHNASCNRLQRHARLQFCTKSSHMDNAPPLLLLLPTLPHAQVPASAAAGLLSAAGPNATRTAAAREHRCLQQAQQQSRTHSVRPAVHPGLPRGHEPTHTRCIARPALQRQPAAA